MLTDTQMGRYASVLLWALKTARRGKLKRKDIVLIRYELDAMKTELENLLQPNGQPYRLIALPWPSAQWCSTGERLPASYANFLIINTAVLVPAYQDDADEIACEVIQSAFPEREVIPVNCRPLIEQFGSLHCLTMQLPEGGLNAT